MTCGSPPGYISSTAGREHHVHALLAADREVGVEGARVAVEVLAGPELQRVDEHRHDDGVGAACAGLVASARRAPRAGRPSSGRAPPGRRARRARRQRRGELGAGVARRRRRRRGGGRCVDQRARRLGEQASLSSRELARPGSAAAARRAPPGWRSPGPSRRRTSSVPGRGDRDVGEVGRARSPRRRARSGRSGRRRRRRARCRARRSAAAAASRPDRSTPDSRSRSIAWLTRVTRWLAPCARPRGRACGRPPRPTRRVRRGPRPAPRPAAAGRASRSHAEDAAGEPGEVDVGAGEGHRRVHREHPAPRRRPGCRTARPCLPEVCTTCWPARMAPEAASMRHHVGEHVVRHGEQQQVARARDGRRLVDRARPEAASRCGCATRRTRLRRRDHVARRAQCGREDGADPAGADDPDTGQGTHHLSFQSSREVPDGVLMCARRAYARRYHPDPAPEVASVTAVTLVEVPERAARGPSKPRSGPRGGAGGFDKLDAWVRSARRCGVVSTSSTSDGSGPRGGAGWFRQAQPAMAGWFRQAQPAMGQVRAEVRGGC